MYWGENWAVIAGHRIKLQGAHTKLPFSRAFILRTYPLQTHEMLFEMRLPRFSARSVACHGGTF